MHRLVLAKSRGAMYFPFINMLPCPPNALGVRNGRVHCCPQCHFILEADLGRISTQPQWRPHHLCQLLPGQVPRCHGRWGLWTSPFPDRCDLSPRQLHVGVLPVWSWSVCRWRVPAARQTRPGVVGRVSLSSPFSPSTLLLPVPSQWTPRAWCRLVISATMTYTPSGLSMRARAWVPPPLLLLVYPVPTPSRPAPLGPASTAARPLCVSSAGRSSAGKAGCALSLWPGCPCFLYAPRSTRTLLVDDGRRLVIGSCVECKAMVQVGQSMQQDRDRLGTWSLRRGEERTRISLAAV